ncbi:PH domain-containing protein [Mesobacillus maritimus]|uniref:PH domain-containing protein n=1 Tax=Mesobacillus maritimus TaxID=1643336 RepID=A0ABS7KBA3_9BACI|nr:PH domain-containing protein [Mesobacillus maritimus]MBY0099551.1 PH domain-containing protein [Mesobacillus maritimus]
MVPEPQTRISKRALVVWRITGVITSLFSWIVGGALVTLGVLFDWPVWMIIALIILILIFSYLFTFFFPKLRWKRWRYEVREQEIEIQRGVFIMKRTLIPMVRVQHVDTQQGPLLRKYQLSTVMISTAATVHEIPALEMDEAEELRRSISRLARVADEDV